MRSGGEEESRMGTPAVVEVEISADRTARLADAVKAARCDAVTQTQ
jgi:hypothetical protein